MKNYNNDDSKSSDTQSKNGKINKVKKLRLLTKMVFSGLPDNNVEVKIAIPEY